MLGLSHVALQIALCSAATKLAPDSTIAVRVRMTYPVGDPEVDKTFTVTNDDGATAFVEFDIRAGQYRMLVEAPKLGCSASKYLSVLKDLNRKVAVTLVAGPPERPRPQLVMDGTAPMSFLYTKPTYVLIDKAVARNAPVVTPAVAQIDYEYDQGAYYLWMYGDPAAASDAPTIALRLKTPTGLAHYIRVNIPYSEIHPGWPDNLRFDVSEDMIDEMATEKTDILLCPKLWETKVSG